MEIPFEKRIWGAQAVADYLDINYDTFMKKVRYTPGFPPPLPAFPGHPKWCAGEVADWALARPESRENHANSRIPA